MKNPHRGGENKKMRNSKIRDLTFMAIFIVLIAIGARITIPVPVCPFTLQLEFTTLAALILGWKKGGFAVFAYVLLGLAGLPVFAAGGGPGYIVQPTFGYLAGYIFGTIVTGLIAGKNREHKSFIRLLAANLAGLMVVYAFGMAYLWFIRNIYMTGNPITFEALVIYCFLLAVPGDILLCVFAAELGRRLLPVLEKNDLLLDNRTQVAGV